MSKITPAIVKDMQFLPEHFNPVEDFDVWLQGVIDTQEALLKIRIGSLYDSADQTIDGQVKQAALNMICDDLTERRILRVSGNVTEDTASIIRTLMEMRKAFKDSAASSISRLISSGSASDSGNYAGGVVVTGGDSLLTRFP